MWAEGPADCALMVSVNTRLSSAKVRLLSPLKQELDEGAAGGEGPVRGQEHVDEVGLPAVGVEEVGDQTLRGGGFQPAHLHRVVLHAAVGRREVQREIRRLGVLQDGFPAQGDPEHGPVLLLLAPLLHRILRGEGRVVGMMETSFSFAETFTKLH